MRQVIPALAGALTVAGLVLSGCVVDVLVAEPACGNAVCGDEENIALCPQDCQPGRCGNNTCETGETLENCPVDCPAAVCGNEVCERGEHPGTCPVDCPVTGKLDVLFVVDNSGSIEGELAQIAGQTSAMLDALRSLGGVLPDIRIGVTTTDLGAGGHSVAQCTGSGDGGALVRGPECGLAGTPYLVDADPAGCNIARFPDGTCSTHDCTAANCLDPGTTFVTDATTQCPRCQNYASTASHPSVLGCLVDLGSGGCGFEQPLEAARLALAGHPANADFVRPEAILLVVFVLDEDDCSASDPQLFDPSSSALDSPLGPMTSYRCFEWGVTCDTDERTHVGERYGCVPRDDPQALVHAVGRYTAFLSSIKQPGKVVVATIAGPSGMPGTVTVVRDQLDQPRLEPSCQTSGGSQAYAGIRLRALTEAFTDPASIDMVYRSICDTTFSDTLTAVGVELKIRLKGE